MSSPFIDSLPRAWSGVAGKAVLRRFPEDFFVDEVPVVEPSGSGEHLLLQVEKRNSNTDWIAKLLARQVGVPLRDVGYAGKKDRYAVTRQWFSIRLAGKAEPDLSLLESDEMRVLQAARHNRKLKIGALKGNRFMLMLRDLEGDRNAMESVLKKISTEGVPNYFGNQRFGNEDGNLLAAEAMFAGELGKVPRHKKGFYLSAARSYLFNQVLAERLQQGCWNRLIEGDWAMLDGRRSGFHVERLDETLGQRCNEMDIHPSGPLYGRGDAMVSSDALALEQRVLEGLVDWCQGLTRFGLEIERRPLRMRVDDLTWEWTSEGLRLSFRLSKGSYATALLRELVDYRQDGQGEQGDQ